MRWMKLEPIIQCEVSQKEKHQYSTLTHIYGILGLTSLTSLQSKGLSRVFSNTTVQKHQFFGPVRHQFPELAQTHVHWVSDATQLSHPLSPLPPSVFPSIKVFSNELTLPIWWPKYWIFKILNQSVCSFLICKVTATYYHLCLLIALITVK